MLHRLRFLMDERNRMTAIKSANAGAVATLTIDRATEGNTLTVEMLRELATAVRAAGARGRGARSRPPMKRRANVCEPILDVYDAIAGARQPIVAVVQGRAHGFGASVAGACDLTIAAGDAPFRLPEMERDLPPTLAVSALMARVPRKALTWMVYSMDELDARTARQIGIVSKVAPSAQVEGEVAKLLATMTARSPESLVAMKDFFRVAPQMEPRGMADYAANLTAGVLSSAGKGPICRGRMHFTAEGGVVEFSLTVIARASGQSSNPRRF